MSYVPEKGDIVSINYESASGQEVSRKPAFVLSSKMFNEHTGFAVMTPITSNVRNMKLEVLLPESLSTKGAILIHQIKSFDFEARDATFIEKAPQSITEEVTEMAKIVIS